MRLEKLQIEGLVVVHPRVFEDGRGFFLESYNKKKYLEHGFEDIEFIQDNLSKSSKGVLRGLHFQNPPYAQGKLVTVIKGAVLDVAVDIRKNSPTYGQHHAITLSEANKTQFYIPPGFAHGFVTLEEDTIFAYKCTKGYHKASERAIRWDDKDLKIDWGVENPIISEKDAIAPLFLQLESKF